MIMIRKLVILFLISVLIHPVFAQSNVSVLDIEQEMKDLYDELAQIDRSINSYNSLEKHETEYLSHSKLMESCFNTYSAEIRENKALLYQIYEDYQTLYISIGKKINGIRQSEAQRLENERIKAKLESYKSDIDELLPKAKSFCNKKKADSLEKSKSKANTIFNQATFIQTSNMSLFDENDNLNSLMDGIGKCHDEIIALTIKKSRIWDIIFKVIMIVGVVLMAGNIVISKIKMIKSQKQAAQTNVQKVKQVQNKQDGDGFSL